MASTESAVAPVEERPPPPKLDELMLAMDVVDTLRHQDALVRKELTQEGRDEVLKARLREMYESQGLTVTDRILDEGIRALKESRFTYTPRGTGFARFMANLWVNRRVAGTALAAIVVVIAVAVGWNAIRSGSERRAVEEARIELTETLPRQLDTVGQTTLAAATDPAARAEVEQIIASGREALTLGNAAGAREAIASLDTTRGALNQTYELRIVNRPDQDTGVTRIPDINTRAENFYIIVEPVTSEGQVLSLPVQSEETGQTETVSIWGQRVSEATFNAVARDKTDDGIIENNVLGEKPRGTLTVQYTMDAQPGRITDWQ
ncbi:MAG: hypothetical protein IT535_11710 [Bauldia sp.]|nr:hypothetical protein [Bauldia sp.]